MFKKLNQKTIYQDTWLKLYQDEIELPDGKQGTYAWCDRMDGVGIAVVTPDRKILQHEYRYVVKKMCWELPGGGMGDSATPEIAAVRELEEETGITVSPDQLVRLGVFAPLNSFSTEKVTVFMVEVEETKATSKGSEGGEVIGEQRFVSFDEALRMIDEGDIDDAGIGHIIQMVVRKMSVK